MRPRSGLDLAIQTKEDKPYQSEYHDASVWSRRWLEIDN